MTSWKVSFFSREMHLQMVHFPATSVSLLEENSTIFLVDFQGRHVCILSGSPEKLPKPNRKVESLPTTIFQGQAAKLRGWISLLKYSKIIFCCKIWMKHMRPIPDHLLYNLHVLATLEYSRSIYIYHKCQTKTTDFEPGT